MDIARRINRAHSLWDEIAFLDDTRQESLQYGAAVFRLEAALERFGPGKMTAVIANGEPFVRKALLEKLDSADIPLSTLIDTSAVISESAAIADGVIISPFCFVSSTATIGRNVAIIAGSHIGHDSVIGENCLVSGQVNIAAGCAIDSETYIGMGTQIRQGTRVGQGTIVGMGSVVFSDIGGDLIAMGNPCRPLRRNTNKRIFA
jgi:sugar O-acyltransferase (sialic acid O-acetyltransferase NeuD family)